MANAKPPVSSPKLASATPIRNALAETRNHYENLRWVNSNNRYTAPGQFFSVLNDELDGSLVRSSKKDLARFIAAASCLHLEQAWSYLGRAMGALVSGSAYTAVHMLYYSELRAAMSLLASNGVLIRNYKSVLVQASGIPLRVSHGGTHSAVWDVLEQWLGVQVNVAYLASLVRTPGLNLSSWSDASGGSGSLIPIFGELLKSWGLDLKSHESDRDTRNFVSYDPADLTKTDPALNPAFVRNLIGEVWQLCDPDNSSAFSTLDKKLIRLTLHHQFVSQHGHLEQDPYEAAIDRIARSLPEDSVAPSLLSFLSQSNPTDGLLSAAGVAPDAQASAMTTVIEGMTARATILLRIASGCLTHNLERSGSGSALADFWVRGVYSKRGYLASPSDDIVPGDIWTDMLQVFDDSDSLDAFQSPAEMNELEAEYVAMFTLAGLDRMVAWAA